MLNALRIANLVLLVLFPIAWFAPLMRAGLLPLFGLSEISVITGMQSLWESDVALLIHVNLLRRKVLPVLAWLGKLAMADVFLVALYIVVVKGVGIGRVETAWGLYLFTACILASIVISALTPKAKANA